MRRDELKKLFISIGVLAAVLAPLSAIGEINAAQAIEIIVLFTLVLVTVTYVRRTSEIAEATKEQTTAIKQQADASVKMAEEMREQRIMSSRPIIVQKDVHSTRQTNGIIRELFSWFEIYNAGNSPTIRLEILLLDKEKKLLEKRTDPLFLRANETVRYPPSSLVSHVGSTCYLLCQYQGVFSHDKGQMWYQTWLSFEPIKLQRGGIIVKSGELKFCEVSEKEHIDAFASRSKPK